MERNSVETFLLVSKLRPDLYGCPQHASRRAAASLGIHRARHLVCAFLGVHAVCHHADSAMDGGTRRHSVCDWSITVRLVRTWIAHRAFVQQGETRGNGRFVARYQRKARRSTRWSLIHLATFHAASLIVLSPPKTPCLATKTEHGQTISAVSQADRSCCVQTLVPRLVSVPPKVPAR